MISTYFGRLHNILIHRYLHKHITIDVVAGKTHARYINTSVHSRRYVYLYIIRLNIILYVMANKIFRSEYIFDDYIIHRCKHNNII